MEMPNFRLMIELSTAHLTMATRAILDLWCKSIDHHHHTISECPTLMGVTDYGWLIYATETTEGFPADLVECIAHARMHAADYVLFDSECEEDPDLPTYDEDTSERIAPANGSVTPETAPA
jgi:hypothetical protein